MGRVYRTAQGKNIDVDSLRLTNEQTIAVGNMKVNARGDQLGPGGKVIQTRNQVMDQHYKMHTPMATENQVDQLIQRNQSQGVVSGQGQAIDPAIPDVDPDGVPFEAPVEQAPVEPKLRGSLADSIAKQVSVKQERLDPNMHKPKGPQRI